MTRLRGLQLAIWIPSLAAIAFELALPRIGWSVMAAQLSWVAGLVTAQWLTARDMRR